MSAGKVLAQDEIMALVKGHFKEVWGVAGVGMIHRASRDVARV
jgi:hypothetical protein